MAVKGETKRTSRPLENKAFCHANVTTCGGREKANGKDRKKGGPMGGQERRKAPREYWRGFRGRKKNKQRGRERVGGPLVDVPHRQKKCSTGGGEGGLNLKKKRDRGREPDTQASNDKWSLRKKKKSGYVVRTPNTKLKLQKIAYRGTIGKEGGRRRRR